MEHELCRPCADQAHERVKPQTSLGRRRANCFDLIGTEANAHVNRRLFLLWSLLGLHGEEIYAYTPCVVKQTIMGRWNRRAEREAWTAHITGEKPKQNKFNVAPKEERGAFASNQERDLATNLRALEIAGQIRELKFQERIEVIPADPPHSAVVYVADFTYYDQEGVYHVLDAKGVKTAVYQVKKKALWHLKKIRIEEVCATQKKKRPAFLRRLPR